MKFGNVLKNIAVIGLTAALAACGSSGGGGTAPAADTRTISGRLTGDLSNVGGVVATRQSDGAKFTASVSTAARKNALTGTSATFSVDVPVNDTYTLEVVDADDQPIATVGFATNVNTNTTTTDIPVVDPGATGDGDIDLGGIDLPDGTGDTDADELVEPEHNPLEQVDQDGDGTDDFDDVDDDNDGVEDEMEDDSGDDSSDDSGQDGADDNSDDSQDDSEDDDSADDNKDDSKDGDNNK